MEDDAGPKDAVFWREPYDLRPRTPGAGSAADSGAGGEHAGLHADYSVHPVRMLVQCEIQAGFAFVHAPAAHSAITASTVQPS